MTKEHFIQKWRCHVAGMALFGVASEVKDGTLVRASKVLDIPAQVEALLARMYADMESTRTLEEVKADAKLLSAEDRIKLRTWIETQPKATANGAKQ